MLVCDKTGVVRSKDTEVYPARITVSLLLKDGAGTLDKTHLLYDLTDAACTDLANSIQEYVTAWLNNDIPISLPEKSNKDGLVEVSPVIDPKQRIALYSFQDGLPYPVTEFHGYDTPEDVEALKGLAVKIADEDNTVLRLDALLNENLVTVYEKGKGFTNGFRTD